MTENLYRKKPVVVEAFQITKGNVLGSNGQWPDWLQEAAGKSGSGSVRVIANDHTALEIETLEGTHSASYGDWIIKAAPGEFYPCKPDVFAATYEPLAADSGSMGFHIDVSATAAPQPTVQAVPDGWPTAQMVSAGAEEVDNYYDDGKDIRHREIARFVFQAMLRAAPVGVPSATPSTPAPPAATPAPSAWRPIAEVGEARNARAWVDLWGHLAKDQYAPCIPPRRITNCRFRLNERGHESFWGWFTEGGDEVAATHWMPVPPRPGTLAPTAPAPDDYRGETERMLIELAKAIFDAPTMTAGYEILKDWAWQCGFGVPVAMREGVPAAPDDLAVAKRIAWSLLRDSAFRFKSIDDMWDRIAQLDLTEQYMRAARAARGEDRR